MTAKQNPLVVGLDITGTFIFAIEGALAGIQANLDLLGVLVLGFSTALVGGIIRDVLIGAVPPNALRDWRYTTLAISGGALTFICYHLVVEVPRIALLSLDAAGLAIFAVAGTEKSLDLGISPLIATMMGTITAVGGGMVRDVLLAHIPSVLRTDIYATAALFGSIILVLLRKLGVRPKPAAFFGFLGCFSLRMVAIHLHWHLPSMPPVLG
jgi:uncharacterized membrane protein YeiH